MASFRDLKVWRDGKRLAVAVYTGIQGSEWDHDWSFREQIRRAAVSVPSSIAEGEARKSEKESVRFFRIAMGSLAELVTQLDIAREIGYLDRELYQSLSAGAERPQGSVGALVKARLEGDSKD